MNDQIVSKDHVRAKARAAFDAGRGRDEHGMNWHAAAVQVWQEEWDRCKVARLEQQHLEAA